MDTIFTLPLTQFAIAALVTLLAGVVKGMVGFAMPMLIISGLSTFLPAEMALGMLILPTLFSNAIQALRQSPQAAWQSIKKFRVFMSIGLVALLISAQVYAFLPPRLMFLLIGVPIFGFSVLQLAGWVLVIRPQYRRRAEWLVGGFAGLVGGVSGVWGPPTVSFLTALNTEKSEQMRVQGVIYGLGALALLGAHVQSGVVNAVTLPLSALMVPPALAGMAIGMVFQGRMDAVRFRKITLVFLVLASLNLIQRGFFA